MALNGAEREDNFCHKSAVMYSICKLPEAAPGHHAIPVGQLHRDKVPLKEGSSLGYIRSTHLQAERSVAEATVGGGSLC